MIWIAIQGPVLKVEFPFHPERKWRWDYAHPATSVAIEIDGGIFARIGGGHNRAIAYEHDREKDNEAQLMGWRVFRLTEHLINYEVCGAIANYIKSLDLNTIPNES